MNEEFPYTDVDGEDFARVKIHARNAELGGISRIRDDSDRVESLSEDQLLGQLGECALYRFVGRPAEYFLRRQKIDLDPRQSDGHSDFMNVDVKTTLMRASKVPWAYHLLVRPSERQNGNIFVLALVDQLSPPIRVRFIGWAHDSELTNVSTRFQPTAAQPPPYVLKATELHRMDELQASLHGLTLEKT